MSQRNGLVEGFVARVRSRLNRHRLWTTLIWGSVGTLGLLVAIGLWYTLQGEAVPYAAWGLTFLLAALGTSAPALLRLLSTERAAEFCDHHFRLQDAIRSYLHFSRAGRRDGFYALQAEQTQDRVKPLQPESVRYIAPRRGLILAGCLLVLALPLNLHGPSAATIERHQLEEQMSANTAAINDELAKEVDELQATTQDPDEKELLNPDKLREWVKELKETPDQKEALRQYAQLERKLHEARLALQNKRDEQLLERAAHELETSRETQPLSEELKQKNYDQAAQQLDKLAPQKSDEALDKQRKELARLKAASQHLAAAARATKSAASKSGSASSSSESQPSNESKNEATAPSAKGAGAKGASGEGGSDMAQTMEELSDAVADLDKSLDEAQRQANRLGQCDANAKSKCENCRAAVASQLSQLSKQLKRLGTCKKCESKLAKLCNCCSQCQGQCNGQSQCMFSRPGGKQAGTGTNSDRRTERDELIDNGQTTQLKGTKGNGPSLTTTESAEDGSGVSHRAATVRERQFQRQFESFVAREDVPEQVKQGVKHYFEVIHQLQPETKPGTPQDDSGN